LIDQFWVQLEPVLRGILKEVLGDKAVDPHERPKQLIECPPYFFIEKLVSQAVELLTKPRYPSHVSPLAHPFRELLIQKRLQEGI
jgi:hypothetical protein